MRISEWSSDVCSSDLRADVELAGQLSGVFDAPPPGQAYPYLSFGPDVTSDAGHKTGEGRLHRLQLSLWDDRPERRRRMELMSLVENALKSLAGDIGGHRTVCIRLDRRLVRPGERRVGKSGYCKGTAWG